MSQYDFGEIDPGQTSGAELAELLGDWRDAVLSSHKGGARPAYAVSGTIWVSNGNAPFFYDGQADHEIPLLDEANTFTGNMTIANNQPTLVLAEEGSSESARLFAAGGVLNVQTESGAIRMAGWSSADLTELRVRFDGGWRDVFHEGNLDPIQKDGSDNGQVNITCDDADFIVRDTTDGTANFIWRDISAGKLFLGTPQAPVETRSNAKIDGNLEVTGTSELKGDVTLTNADLTIMSGSPKIIMDDNGGGSQRNSEIGINPVVSGSTYFGAFGIVHQSDGTDDDRAILIQTSVDTGPTWMVGTESYRVLTTAMVAGAVGSLVFAQQFSGATLNYGDTTAGSNLEPEDNDLGGSPAYLSGTWRCLGTAGNNDATLFVRIA